MRNRRIEPRTPRTAAGFRALAVDFAGFLAERGLMDETTIYSHGCRITVRSADCVPDSELTVSGPEKEPPVVLAVSENTPCPCEYANPETMTVTYEGALYDVMDGVYPSMRTDIEKFFEARGLYVEPCWPWAFTLGFA